MSALEAFQICETGHVLGIDVGWSENIDTTGACTLSWDEQNITISVHHVPTEFERRSEALTQIVGEIQYEAVAVDGPLRRGFGLINEYRLAELLLTRRFSNAGYGKPGQSHAGNGILLNQHANELARSVKEANCVKPASHRAAIDENAIVEAFPTTFLAVMLDEDRIPWTRQKSDAFFEGLLGPDSPARQVPDRNRLASLLLRLLPNRTCATNLGNITDHEHRAAVICAITALCVACRNYVAVGDSRNGYILLPPRADEGLVGTKTWAMNMIGVNADEANDWKSDNLSVFPPPPHIIVETPVGVIVSNAEYQDQLGGNPL